MILPRTDIIRDAGRWISERIPATESILRWIYGSLPSRLHDHPADFLKRYFAHHKRVRFIQIGAYDGIAGDPIWPNVAENAAWSGILIEPNPTLFERLKTNYAEREGLVFMCVAVSDKAGARPFYVFNAREKTTAFPSWWSEIASLDWAHLARELPNEVHIHIEEIEVPVLTLQDIVSKHPGTVNLIVMDVEGHEAPILRSILDSDVRPDVLVFEHKHLVPSDLNEAASEFARLHYQLKIYGRDAILYRSYCSE